MKNIWSLSFVTNIYDFVMPITYKMSLKKSFELLNPSQGHLILDAGCGNGNLLTYAKDWLSKENGSLVGIDINEKGLAASEKRAERLSLKSKNVIFKKQNLIHDIENIEYDGIISHFAIYTINDHSERLMVLKNLKKQLKKNALLVLALPSEKYCAAGIVEEAIQEEKLQKKYFSFNYYFRKYFIYLLTEKALKTIEKEMDKGNFHRFTSAEILDILTETGFSDINIQQTYGGHGYLATARKR